MSTRTPSRRPAGSPASAGGQFASDIRGESDLDLRDTAGSPVPARDWGQVVLNVGSRTPWGSAQHVAPMGDGAAVCMTARHGGIKLSRERNAAIPRPLRRASGWYEVDCEIHIVAVFHPELFAGEGRGPEEVKSASLPEMQRWFADEYATLDDIGAFDDVAGDAR